jgi:hypothetical protein
MMQEDLHGAFSLSSLDRRGDEPRRASRRYVATGIARALDRTAQQKSPLWPLTGWAAHGTGAASSREKYQAAVGDPADRRRHLAVARARPFASRAA